MEQTTSRNIELLESEKVSKELGEHYIKTNKNEESYTLTIGKSKLEFSYCIEEVFKGTTVVAYKMNANLSRNFYRINDEKFSFIGLTSGGHPLNAVYEARIEIEINDLINEILYDAKKTFSTILNVTNYKVAIENEISLTYHANPFDKLNPRPAFKDEKVETDEFGELIYTITRKIEKLP